MKMKGSSFEVGKGNPLIDFRNVDIYNGDNLILSNVNLVVEEGEFLYLIGKVGSGKSSILKSITGELPIEKGDRAIVGGFDLLNLKNKQIPYLRRNIGVVFQNFQLLMDMTVEENLLFVLEATGWRDKREMANRVEEVLEMVGMSRKSHKMPHQLSGGEQQRVTIARALLNNPPLMLADEPTGNLDMGATLEIMDLLIKIHKEKNQAIILVTHNRALYNRYPAKVMVCGNNECKLALDYNSNDEILNDEKIPD